jgi:transcriptional regulator GlxA family with amidase domain
MIISSWRKQAKSARFVPDSTQSLETMPSSPQSRFGKEADDPATLSPPVRVAILVLPDTTASVLYGLHDLFLSAGMDWAVLTEGRPGRMLLEPLLVSRAPGPVRVCHGVRVDTEVTLADCPEMPIVCVPEVNLPPGTPLAELFPQEIAWLAERFRAGATLATSCSGAMLLAEAGVLDGEEATTHWAWCDVMQSRFPRVKVRPQRSLVVSGDGHRLIMAGGGTSWLDLALYLIARVAGPEVAMQVARVNLIDWHHIGQQPFARLARTRQVEDAVIGRCQVWVAEHYDESNPVREMVRLSGLPERTFKRRFRLSTGMSPLEYVHTVRIEEAKQLLETSTAPIEEVAREVGYEDPAFFGRLFRRNVNLTAAQYRKRFGGLRASLSSG